MTDDNINIELNVEVPMRDGTLLRADIYRPETKEPLPTLVVRTPYDKTAPRTALFLEPVRMAKNGYAVVLQDCRGCAASDGDFYPFKNEARDGYDTVEWAAVQPWSSGKVGMYGISYLGLVQWTTARERPPHLVTICPSMIPPNPRVSFYVHGVFSLQAALYWGTAMSLLRGSKLLPPEELARLATRMLDAQDNLEHEARHLPLTEHPLFRETGLADFFFDWLAHPENDEYWRELEYANYGKTNVPALIMAGWYDCCTDLGALSTYTGIKQQGASEQARQHSRLIVGPWFHEGYLFQQVGDIDFGARAAAATIDFTGMQLRWFDYWLKGIDNGVLDDPPVKLFVMGDNVWRDENEWPLARTQYTPYYLHSNGSANSLHGDGRLSPELPGEQAPDHFVYDPANPVPTNGGSILTNLRGNGGPLDQRELEQRQDLLVYTSQELADDLEVTGPISVTLFAASSAVDTDFTAKLVDVWPDGRAYNLVDGIVRARYREGDKKVSFIEPEKVYEYRIDLQPTSNVFKAGHQIRIEISSSNFPKYDRNLNTGEAIGQSETMLCAEQTIFHDRERPSCVILPLIPR